MRAPRAPGYAFGLALLMIAPVALADEAPLGLSPPEAPGPLGIEAEGAPKPDASGRLAAAGDEFVLPDLPEAGVVVTEPGTVASIEPRIHPIAAALAARIADPALPLPPRLSRKERDALASAYALREHRPAWITDGGWTPAARLVLDRLARADEDGLDPVAYPVPRLEGGSRPPTADELAEADAKLSASAYLYAKDARGGRIDPARIGGLVTPKLELPAVETLLLVLTESLDPGAALGSYNPGYPGYVALKRKLAELRASRPSRPAVGLAPARGGREASAAGLPGRFADGRLEGDIVANMERWRWLPSGVAPRYVAVNIPEFRLRLMDGQQVVHSTRVITGKPETPTPIFTGRMDHAIVNPSWFIPPSILKKEILPGLARDPGYAARRGYQVVRRGKSISVKQPPGDRNALGYIKFMFPNDHAVYLHDTPNRGLFGAGSRAFSHGCVRVEQPFAFGGKLLGPTWPEGRLKSLIGYGERTIFLPDKLPVHLTYFTVAVDELGDIATFGDIYGYHRRVRAALGLGA